MLEKLKKVYYCEYCKRHGMSKYAIEKHELRCTLNPRRECRWCWDSLSGRERLERQQSLLPNPLLAHLGKHVLSDFRLRREDIDWVHDLVDGCPACMLAILRQSNIQYAHDAQGITLFDYDEAVEQWRPMEWEREQLAEIDAIQRTWL